MEAAIEKAKVLIEALEWIRKFRERYVIIKLGGSALDDPESVKRCLKDVVFMQSVGMHPVLIHGGGKAISRGMDAAGIEPNFVQGRRYTDEATLDIAIDVLTNQLSADLVEKISAIGGHAVPMHLNTQNVLFGELLQLPNPGGEPIDLGRVGQVTRVDDIVLRTTCRAGAVPVLPSIALDQNGTPLNVNADSAAAAVARLLNVEKLVFLSDVPGIFLDKDDPSTLVSHLTVQQCRDYIEDGTIATGMVPKVEAALEALDAGVRKIHIVDAAIPHSLLLEIYSDTGVGTEIVP